MPSIGNADRMPAYPRLVKDIRWAHQKSFTALHVGNVSVLSSSCTDHPVGRTLAFSLISPDLVLEMLWRYRRKVIGFHAVMPRRFGHTILVDGILPSGFRLQRFRHSCGASLSLVSYSIHLLFKDLWSTRQALVEY